RVVGRGVLVDVERGRMRAQRLEPGLHLDDQIATRPREPLGHRDLRELGPHPDPPANGALDDVAAQLAPARERESARTRQVILARGPRESPRDRGRAPYGLRGVELRELDVGNLAGL